MDQTQDFKSLQDQVQAALVATTRTAGKVSSEDLPFYRSLDSKVGEALDEQSERLLGLASALLKSAVSISELRAPTLEDADDVENNWRNVVDVVDILLEKSDTCLDEYTGVIKKRKEPATAEQSTAVPTRSKKLSYAFRNQNLVKPQLAFDVKPDNNDTSPWKPLLTKKPHATVSLEESLAMITNDFEQLQYSHPYEPEILSLQYPDSVYKKADPIPYQPVETTSATFVDTEEGVFEMLEELKTASEIAVDLEHHDIRSYVGLVSLMQISTRDKDWIVDTLKPWRQKLQVLNEVFADPKIVKVFHGAFMDIVWLQRDLGLYVVGLFDTHWASKSLSYAGGSLAFLLKKFIDFDADKQYQMADWRLRPLPEEMFYYARADTHFLLYIYDNMRNELIDTSNPEVPEENKLEMVLQKSKEVSLLRYERMDYNAESGRGGGGWYNLLLKTPALLSNEQFAVFKAVHEWRDRVARADDDSTACVMTNSVLFNMAKVMPNDMMALLGVAHPISHGVKSRAGELLEIIKAAKAKGKSGPSMMEVLRPEHKPKAKSPVTALSNSPKTLVAEIDQGDLRSGSSAFWGGAFGSSVWDAPKSAQNENVRLAVPLPPLSSEIFATLAPAITPQAEEDFVELESAASKEPPQEEPFVLKRGPKRKSEAVSESEASGAEENEISINEGELTSSQKRLEKKSRKAARKAARSGPSTGNNTEVGGEEILDYSKAEPVLHGKRDGRGKGNKQKPFDPYTKSADAPKGMRRAQTERAGKSHTFKK